MGGLWRRWPRSRGISGGTSSRKNLLWLSESFPITITRDPQSTGDPFLGEVSFADRYRRTVDLLARSQVAVYPIDPNGLAAPPSQSSVRETYNGDPAAARRLNGSTSLIPQDDEFFKNRLEGQLTMDDLAESTGGKAFYNTNDLQGSIRQAEADGQHFYRLTYAPPAPRRAGEYRSLQVQVEGRGYHLAYRRGYDATTGDPAVPPAEGAAAMAEEMTELAPLSSQIPFTVEPQPAVAAAPGKTIAEKASAAQPHAYYALNFSMDASALRFSPAPDGTVHAALEFATVVFDRKGKVVDSRADRVVLALDSARYGAVREGGLRFHQTICLPNRGEPAVRVAVQDLSTNHIGTVELTAAEVRGSAEGTDGR